MGDRPEGLALELLHPHLLALALALSLPCLSLSRWAGGSGEDATIARHGVMGGGVRDSREPGGVRVGARSTA